MTPGATHAPIATWGRRFPPLAFVALASVSAMAIERGREPRAGCAALVAVAMAFAASRRPNAIARLAGWGLAFVLASLGVPDGSSRALDAASALGELSCVVAACLGIAHVPPSEGLVKAAPHSSGSAIGIAIAAWWLALTAAVAPEKRSVAWMTRYPAAWESAAISVSALVIVVACERLRIRRRLELGVAERVRAIRTWLATVSLASVLIGALASEDVGDVARLGLSVGATCITWAALHSDAAAVARAARRVGVLAFIGGTVALLGASAVAGRAGDPWLLTFSTAVAGLAIGSAASRIESPLRPAGGAWLDAFERASEAAMHADPREAVRGVLFALRSPLGVASPSPELWTFCPSRVMTVDAAGYAHEREQQSPSELAEVATEEPFGTLRVELLDALEVRRPEIRSIASWMAERGALLATVVACDGETEAVLVLPRGRRGAPSTLEEIRGVKRVADRLAVACRARGTELRLLERVQHAMARADAAVEAMERLQHQRARDVERHALDAARLARPATVGVYGSSSRMALEALERRTAIGAPVAVVSPSGVDPAPYLARAHLSGSRGRGPLVLIDATIAREHDVVRWTDPNRSPLAIAEGGMLVLLDANALPADVQRLIARACLEARAPWGRADPLDVQLAITGISSPDELVTAGRLDSALAARLGEARAVPVVLPRLRDRPEDFRAILTDRLAREGLRVRGHAVGIENAAYLRLAEYAFPGDDAELSALVIRMVARCEGDRVRVADLDRPHFPAISDDLCESGRRKDPLSA
ncbi:MAG: hypothetical protein ABSF69_06390 [Polyangiaceae bacterium]|jgi:hypothetical protein